MAYEIEVTILKRVDVVGHFWNFGRHAVAYAA